MYCSLFPGGEKSVYNIKDDKKKKKSTVPVTQCLWPKGTKLNIESLVGCAFLCSSA